MALGITGSARNALTWKRNVASTASSATNVIWGLFSTSGISYLLATLTKFFVFWLAVNFATCFQLLNMTGWVCTAWEKNSHPVRNKSFRSRWRIHGKFPKSGIASLVQMLSARPKCCSALPKPGLLDGIVCHFLYHMLIVSSATLCPNVRHSAALKKSSRATSARCHVADAANWWKLRCGLPCLRHVCEVVWFTVWCKNLYIRSDLQVRCVEFIVQKSDLLLKTKPPLLLYNSSTRVPWPRRDLVCYCRLSILFKVQNHFCFDATEWWSKTFFFFATPFCIPSKERIAVKSRSCYTARF